MRRVDAHFKGLQPIAVPQALEGEGMASWRVEAIEGRHWWRRKLSRAEPAEQHATVLAHWITTLGDTLMKRAAGRFRGRFQAAAVECKLPAVKRAAQAVAFVPAKRQIGAAMGAVTIKQAPVVLRVFEQHKILTENANGL